MKLMMILWYDNRCWTRSMRRQRTLSNLQPYQAQRAAKSCHDFWQLPHMIAGFEIKMVELKSCSPEGATLMCSPFEVSFWYWAVYCWWMIKISDFYICYLFIFWVGYGRQHPCPWRAIFYIKKFVVYPCWIYNLLSPLIGALVCSNFNSELCISMGKTRWLLAGWVCKRSRWV